MNFDAATTPSGVERRRAPALPPRDGTAGLADGGSFRQAPSTLMTVVIETDEREEASVNLPFDRDVWDELVEGVGRARVDFTVRMDGGWLASASGVLKRLERT